MAKNMVVASTSTLHGSGYLQYLMPRLETLYAGINQILFIPFARPGGISHDTYTEVAAKAFKELGKQVEGLHQFSDPQRAVADAEGIFTGGGNTFVLVNELHRRDLMAPLREVLHAGIPYLGTSAGSNICGLSMQTTNDMPIVYPPSFKTLGMLPFNINPHYLDPDPSSTHMGETRETRIKEYHTQNSVPVVGLREGSWLDVSDEAVLLSGAHSARIFVAGKDPYEVQTGSDLSGIS